MKNKLKNLNEFISPVTNSDSPKNPFLDVHGVLAEMIHGSTMSLNSSLNTRLDLN